MTDDTLEKIVANLLRSGVILAAAVVLGGGICYLLGHGHEIANYHVFRAEPPHYRFVRQIVSGAMQGECGAVIQFGLLLLIATPVARVAISIVGFAMEKDRTYVAITSLVLAILLYSLIGKP